ncbi:NAD(P)-binding protein [Lentinula guzmanii]|uniref:NAD(P)-binding protein n=1 Tax=Lentinula guzmanii TaxID=2804957 RepID=A0AA38N1Q0_9AGAR|nr:NAD(P)-binding protein [Lentinula guzmanii]
MTKILMTGVTGYIGGTVLTRFAQRPDFEDFDIRCIVRSPEKAEKIKSLFKNVAPIVGSHSDISLMTEASSKVDVVIAMADCDDVDAATGTLQGLKKRFEKTGSKPIFINTSGTGVLSDTAAGMYATDTIWDDANPEQMATLKPTQPHRPVDLKIVSADAEGYVNTYIILPPTIWGISRGHLFDSGISNKKSVQIPALIRASLDRGHAGMVGLGKNIWHNVEVHELSDLYSILFDAVLSPLPNLGHGREGYFFGANEEHTLYQVGKSISDVMFKMSKSKGGEPSTFTKEEVDKYFNGSSYLGSNSRCRSNRSKTLGWAPKKTTEDMLESIYPETELVIEIGALTASEKL